MPLSENPFFGAFLDPSQQHGSSNKLFRYFGGSDG
jgi:hypothetical protein